MLTFHRLVISLMLYFTDLLQLGILGIIKYMNIQ